MAAGGERIRPAGHDRASAARSARTSSGPVAADRERDDEPIAARVDPDDDGLGRRSAADQLGLEHQVVDRRSRPETSPPL